MLLERILRLDGAKSPPVPDTLMCLYWREIIRGGFDMPSLQLRFNLNNQELMEFRKIFFEPYSDWTRAERIKLTYRVEDLFRIADQEHRAGRPVTVKRFLELLDSYDKDAE